MGNKLHLAAYLLTVLGFTISMLLISEQIKLYKDRPSSPEWRELHNSIYLKNLPYDAISFEPLWLSGYATDRNNLNFIDVIDYKKILNNKVITPRRLWFVSMKDGSTSLKNLISEKYSINLTFELSSLRVFLLENKERQIAYSFVDNLKGANAYIEKQGEKIHGMYKSESFKFSNNLPEWNDVKIRDSTYSYGQERKRGISFHPSLLGRKIIEYVNIPAGEILATQVWLSDTGRSYGKRPSTIFSIEINDEIKYQAKIDENNPEQYIELKLKKKSNKIRFIIESDSESVEKRHVFFSSQILKSDKE